ncbi:MAG: glutamine--fructose-6-phosphate transaminase (isomerizing) [Gammaproteobacteria bacterium]|nr:glutamine--fructose-6-phosphate transaminase (isomerizing) [Gammaproteobacteria bacterium]
MCGIVGAVAQRDVGEILLEGLKALEYRGYDSAGIAIIDPKNQLTCLRTQGKVQELVNLYKKSPVLGKTGIAHTRWATHGKPSECNAHPHLSGETIAVVHNGIIENYESLRKELVQAGYHFCSETDTETIAHLIHQEYTNTHDFLQSVKNVVKKLKGAYALAILNKAEPDHIIGVRFGSPLVVGLGIGENFIASDLAALLPVTQKGLILENGDIVDVHRDHVDIFDKTGKKTNRSIYESELTLDAVNRGQYQHFMLKEIFEQPKVLEATLQNSFSDHHVLIESFGHKARELFPKIKQIQIVACGTSYYAGMIARYWIEDIAQIPCQVEIASEIRYRRTIVAPNTLFVTISQSGETADTLEALRQAKDLGYMGSLTICNTPESSLVRESDLAFITRAGKEIGVASTKAFTTQLAALCCLTLAIAQHTTPAKNLKKLVEDLKHIPEIASKTLETTNRAIKDLSGYFADKKNALFLGRGIQYPIALEGALKLKEIAYVHAEGYPAGELKHGPLALVDKNMPVITVAPNDDLLEKLKSNLQEVRARGGQLIVFNDDQTGIKNQEGIMSIKMPKVNPILAPLIYVIPLQLLAYYVALIKGTDIDHPRNLAKSVTVE